MFLSALTDRERFLLLNKEYGSLVKEQEKQNAKIDDEVKNLAHAPNILLFEDFQAIYLFDSGERQMLALIALEVVVVAFNVCL